METKLLLLDMDGTLLNSDRELTQRTLNAVDKAIKKGVMVAVASGRMYKSLAPYLEKLNLYGPVINCNGAMISNFRDDEVIYQNPIPMDMAKKVLKFSESLGVYCQYYTEDNYYFKKHCKISDYYHKFTGVKGKQTEDVLYKSISTPPLKILAIEEDDNFLNAYEKIKNEFDDLLEISSSSNKFIEIMNKGVNKGAALLSLCEIYNINIENTIAIGDGQNDIQMIEKAAIGVAVESGDKKLIDKADIICAGANSDGPAKFIEEYILSK